MILEMRAEGVTRFIAVFHSDLPEPVGPVRSARTSDFDLLTALNEPVFAYSGANAIVDRGLGALPIYARYEDRVDFFRAQNRNAPHNLYVNPLGLQEKMPAPMHEAPQPWFRFGTPEEVGAQGRAISGNVTVVFKGSPLVTYQWDREVEGWLRTQDGASHSTVSGDQLAPANVVILESSYGVSPADAESPELNLGRFRCADRAHRRSGDLRDLGTAVEHRAARTHRSRRERDRFSCRARPGSCSRIEV